MLATAVAVTIMKVIVENNKGKKITVVNVVLSLMLSICCGYLVYPALTASVSQHWISIIFGILILTAEKIITFIIYELEVGEKLLWLVNYLFEKLKKMM